MNSFRFIRAALEYEIERQVEVMESGGARGAGDALLERRRGAHVLDAIEGSRRMTTATSLSRTCRR